jgi:hypothetical protein
MARALSCVGMSKVDGLDPKPENRVFAAKFANVPIMLRKFISASAANCCLL